MFVSWMIFCGPRGEIKPERRPGRGSVVVATEWNIHLSFILYFRCMRCWVADWLYSPIIIMRILVCIVTLPHLYFSPPVYNVPAKPSYYIGQLSGRKI